MMVMKDKRQLLSEWEGINTVQATRGYPGRWLHLCELFVFVFLARRLYFRGETVESTHTHTHARTHARTHINTHTHIHTHTHTHTYTHTHTILP